MHLGVKAHWRDADVMAGLARAHGARTLEVHLARRDVADDRGRVLAAFRPLAREFRLVVHQPEWVELDGAAFFLNPSSPDAEERALALRALARTTDLARDLDAAGVVVHPGGIELAGKARGGRADLLRETLAWARAAAAGVPLWLENMPWFYGWEEGRAGLCGRATLGRSPDDVRDVEAVVDGFCLDFCHAFLSAPPPADGWARVDAFLRAWGPRIRHVHASGAVQLPEPHPNPREGEGVSFGAGGMDAAGYRARLRTLGPDVAVVPEIYDGHREGGRAFADALAWLRALDD